MPTVSRGRLLWGAILIALAASYCLTGYLGFESWSLSKPPPPAPIPPPAPDPRLLRLESFLANQFNGSVGLVRESPDPPLTRNYWLLSDNLIAMHVLPDPVLGINYPDKAAQINQTMQKCGYFTDGLHEVLFGSVIQFPPYTPVFKVVENSSFLVEVEVRSNSTGKLQPDWTNYADLLIYGALSAHNAGNDPLAIDYFNRALNMWNGAGLWDFPTQHDGFYATYKLALLMYAADILNQTIPYRADLENRIWQFQRDDGGIRAFYLGNMTSNREANSETAGLVLLAYQNKMHKDEMIYGVAQQNYSREIQQESEARTQLIQETIIAAIVAVALTAGAFYVRRKQQMERVEPKPKAPETPPAERKPPVDDTRKFCSQCGKPLIVGSNYCSSCGARQ